MSSVAKNPVADPAVPEAQQAARLSVELSLLFNGSAIKEERLRQIIERILAAPASVAQEVYVGQRCNWGSLHGGVKHSDFNWAQPHPWLQKIARKGGACLRQALDGGADPAWIFKSPGAPLLPDAKLAEALYACWHPQAISLFSRQTQLALLGAFEKRPGADLPVFYSGLRAAMAQDVALLWPNAQGAKSAVELGALKRLDPYAKRLGKLKALGELASIAPVISAKLGLAEADEGAFAFTELQERRQSALYKLIYDPEAFITLMPLCGFSSPEAFQARCPKGDWGGGALWATMLAQKKAWGVLERFLDEGANPWMICGEMGAQKMGGLGLFEALAQCARVPAGADSEPGLAEAARAWVDAALRDAVKMDPQRPERLVAEAWERESAKAQQASPGPVWACLAARMQQEGLSQALPQGAPAARAKPRAL